MSASYQTRIQAACSCDSAEAACIENVMRDFVLHSTLDWLSASQFIAAARAAQRLYRAEKIMFDDYFASLRAQFQNILHTTG